MHTIAILSQKGGAGKTTIACAIAVASERAGRETVLVDLDPQASASKWTDLRETENPVVTSAHAPRLAPVLAAAREAGAEAEPQRAVLDNVLPDYVRSHVGGTPQPFRGDLASRPAFGSAFEPVQQSLSVPTGRFSRRRADRMRIVRNQESPWKHRDTPYPVGRYWLDAIARNSPREPSLKFAAGRIGGRASPSQSLPAPRRRNRLVSR